MQNSLITIVFLFFPLLLQAREPINTGPLKPANAIPFTKAQRQEPGSLHKMQALPGLLFVENKGQVTNQYGNSRADIDFKLKVANGLSVFIGKGTLHYQWTDNSKFKSKSSKVDNGVGDKAGRFSSYRMDVALVNANPDAELIAEEAQDYYETYYTLPSNKEKGIVVHSYKKIIYKDIYPNIDWVIYIRSNNVHTTSLSSGEGRGDVLEYDFVVRPGGNVKDIRIKYSGADKRNMENGSVTFTTPMGSISEHRPIAYDAQSRNPVKSRFRIHDNILGFAVADHEGTLIIDPTLDWATYFGGLGDECGYATACDAQANIYMTGETSSISNIATAGAFQTTVGGGSDAFIVQYNSAGQRIWATYYGGSGTDEGEGIAYDNLGSIYVCGSTSSSSGIATSLAHQTIYGGGISDGFLVKFNTAGARIWGTYYGGSNYDNARSVTCHSGYIYTCGDTRSDSNIATTGSYKDTLNGGADAFIAKFNLSGTLQWATYYGGDSLEFAYGITDDTSGNLYIGGQTYSANGIASNGTYQDTLKGLADAFLSKFDSSGAFQWGSYYGGTGMETGYSVATDLSGKVYLTGETNSTSNIASSSSFQASFSGGTSDGFLAQFNLSGSLQWASYYGGISEDESRAVKCDKNGKVYMTGRTASNTNIATAGSYQSTYGGGNFDAFLVQFNTTGQRLWGTYFGGSAEDDAYGLAIDGNGNASFSGATASSSNIASANAYQGTYGGGNYDAFLARFKIDTLVALALPFIDTVFCAADTFHLSFTTVDTFQPTNVFTAQLSDSSGSFATAADIGTYSGTTSGSIFCAIPSGAVSGSHYRIRVFSSHPVDTSIADSLNIVIKGFPTHSIGYNPPLCAGDTLRLYDTAATSLYYHWRGPNSISSLLQDPYFVNINPPDSGYYYVTDSFPNGCKFRDSVFVSIGTRPLKAAASSNSPVCAGDTLKLNATDNTSGVTYQWSGPNAFSALVQSPYVASASLVDSGRYIVKAVINNCYSAPDTIHVTVNPSVIPAVNFYTVPTVVTPGQTDTFHTIVVNGGNSATYQWYLDGTAISGATQAFYITSLNSTDVLCVLIHSNALCAIPDTATVCIQPDLGVGNVNASEGIRLYPNPAASVVYISAPVQVSIVLSDIQGNTVYSGPGTKGIDISYLPCGLYIARIYGNNNLLLKTEKLVKVP